MQLRFQARVTNIQGHMHKMKVNPSAQLSIQAEKVEAELTAVLELLPKVHGGVHVVYR